MPSASRTRKEMVPRHGLEPWTNWLRVSCSTNWANDPRVFCPRSSRENGCIENGGPCQHILRTFWIFSSIKRKNLFFQLVRRQHLSSLLPAASHTPHQPTQENAASHNGAPTGFPHQKRHTFYQHHPACCWICKTICLNLTRLYHSTWLLCFSNILKYILFIQSFRWWDLWLGDFIGYFFGILRK